MRCVFESRDFLQVPFIYIRSCRQHVLLLTRFNEKILTNLIITLLLCVVDDFTRTSSTQQLASAVTALTFRCISHFGNECSCSAAAVTSPRGAAEIQICYQQRGTEF
jgi:hypothetical protein